LKEMPAAEKTTAGDPAVADRARQLRDSIGRPPEELAEQVLQGIKDNQFYIITHDEYDDVIRERMENILTRRNPDPKGPGLTWIRPREG
jgi:hypothetical protein